MKRLLNVPHWVIMTLAAALSLAVYVMASALTYRVGFPLDDAWIHQTYARNFALTGQWAFLPGQVSAGSTAPLWSLLLSFGYWMHIDPLVWAYLAGGVSLAALAWMGEVWVRRLLGNRSAGWPWAAMLLATEWHLVWAAGSGMETLLHAVLIVLIFWLLTQKEKPVFQLGLLTALLVWIRPDGLTVMGPVIFVLIMSRSGWKQVFLSGARYLLGMALIFAPYLLFNYLSGGQWWPNTFFAKQAEYAILLQEPFIMRLARLLSQPLVGIGLLLLPGFCFFVVDRWRRRDWAALSAAIWWIGFTALYALSLPVIYQHARYLIPSMPVYFCLGATGTLLALRQMTGSPWQRLLRFGGVTGLAMVGFAFWVQGALAYGQDVAIIESEMVTVSHWVAQHTPPDALIAAHDIGALGYFGDRRVLDLAGLISPELIPYLRDEEKLAEALDTRGAAYLVTFPGWYPRLIQRGRVIYQTDGLYSIPAGGEAMAVYGWLK